jgi:hypothetical protein
VKLLQRPTRKPEPFLARSCRSDSLQFRVEFRASKPVTRAFAGNRNGRLEPCQGASSGTENHPAPNDPKLGRLRCARQGLVRVSESNTKYGGKGRIQGVRPRLDWGQVSVSPQGFPREKNYPHPVEQGCARCSHGRYFFGRRDCTAETHVGLRGGEVWHARAFVVGCLHKRQGEG